MSGNLLPGTPLLCVTRGGWGRPHGACCCSRATAWPGSAVGSRRLLTLLFPQEHLLKEGLAWLDLQAAGEAHYWLPALFTDLYSQEITAEEAREALP